MGGVFNKITLSTWIYELFLLFLTKISILNLRIGSFLFFESMGVI